MPARSNKPIQEKGKAHQQPSMPFKEGEIIVKFRSETSDAGKASVKTRYGLTTKKATRRNGPELMKVTPGADIHSVIDQLVSSGQVEYAQPNYLYLPRAVTPSDQYWPYMWGLHNTGQSIGTDTGTVDVDIDAPEGWAYTANLPEIIVAVIDSGTDINQPDLIGKIWTNPREIPGNNIDDDGNGYKDDVNGWDFYNNDNTVYDAIDGDLHGTHVSGTIAAAANSAGVIGVAPNVKIMPLKFIGPDGGYTMDAVAAIDYAVAQGAKVSNNSWGRRYTGSSEDLALQDAINRASSSMVFVAAAGNAGANNDILPDAPSGLNATNIISVAAVDNDGNLPDFSNYGRNTVDIGAPGVNILSTYPKLTDGLPAAVQVVNTSPAYRTMFWGFGPNELGTWAEVQDLSRQTMTFLGLPIGATVLLVDDDEESDEQYDVGSFYADVIASLGYTVHPWVVPAGSDGPSAAQMAPYSAVIWITGFAYGNPVRPGDQTALTAYLQSGNKALFMAGEDAAAGMEFTSFFTGTLKAWRQMEYGRNRALRGLGGTTAYAASSFDLAYENGWRDVILPYNPADPTAKIALLYSGLPNYTANDYYFLNGTSMAAPHVSGVAAMVVAQKNVTPQQAIALMMETGMDLGSLGATTVSGRMVNLHGALATQVAQPVVSLAGGQEGQADAYAIASATGGYGKLSAAANNTITVTFPTGTTLPAAIAADQVLVNGTPVGSAAQTILPSGHSVTFRTPVNVEHGANLTIHFTAAAGVRNGPEGSYVLTLSTSTDPLARESSAYSVSAGLALDKAAYRGAGAEDVTWDAGATRVRTKAQVTLTSAAANLNSSQAETVTATVTSTSDAGGIAVTLTETGPDTGLFTGSFGFTPGTSSDAGDLIGVGAAAETITVVAGGRTTTATWAPADETYKVVTGTVAPAAAGTCVTMFSRTTGNLMDTACVGDPSFAADGAFRFELNMTVTDTVSVVAYRAGLAAQADVTLSEAAAMPITVSAPGAVADEYTYALAPLTLAADTTGPALMIISSPVNTKYNVNDLIVNGATETYTFVEIRLDGTVLDTIWTGKSNTFTYPLNDVAEGEHTIRVTSLDFAGNAGEFAQATFLVDTVAPGKPTVDPVNDQSTFVTGATEPLSTVTVARGETTLVTGTAANDGGFSLPIARQTAGTVLTVSVVDQAGNPGLATTSVTVTEVDVTPPALTVNDVDDNDTTVTGSTEANATVKVKVGTTEIASGSAAGDGSFSLTIPVQTAGTVLSVTASDAAGNVSPAVNKTVLDRTAPAQPTVTPVDDNDTTVTGTAEANATVKVSNGTDQWTATAAGTGSYSVTIPVQSAGTTLSVTATDAAGNESAAATTTVLDRTAPATLTVNDVDDNDMAVTGSTEAQATVTVTNGSSTWSNAAGADGAFNVTIPVQSAGTTLSVTAADAAGNSTAPVTKEVADATPPARPTVGFVDDHTTAVTGTAEAGATVKVSNGTDEWTGTAAGDGSYSVTITAQVAGTTLTVTATDAAGNVSPAATVTVGERDVTPPTLTVNDVDDNDTTVTGSTEANATVKVKVGTTEIASGSAAGDGSFSLTIPVQTAGTVLSVTASDAAGNVSPVVNKTVLDRTAPAQPTVNPVDDNDTTVTGTAEASATVKVSNGTDEWTGTAAGDGSYSLTIPAQSAGTTLSVIATDAALNESAATTITVLDRTAPATLTVNDVDDNDTVVTGSTEALATVAVTNGSSTWSSTAGADGTFSVTIPVQTAGTTLSVTATDAAGNTTAAATKVVEDVTPPVMPTVNFVDDHTTTVTGTAEAGSTVKVNAGATELGAATAAGNGTYSVTILPQTAGTVLTVTATDAAGNVSPEATVTVGERDVTPPALAVNEVDDNDTAVTGATEANATVKVKVGATELVSGSAAGDGSFSLTIPMQAAETILSVTATDAAGNPNTVEITVLDGTAPALTVYSLDDTDTAVTGLTEPGVAITVTDGTDTWTGTAAGDGSFSITIPVQPLGTVLTVTATDAASNSASAQVTVGEHDSTPPAAPTVNRVDSNDRAVTGRTEPGALVKVSNGTLEWSAYAAVSGNFSVAIQAQQAGTTLSVTATDAEGNESDPTVVTVAAAYTPPAAPPPVDNTAPEAPMVNPVKDTDTVVTGSAEFGSMVSVTVGGEALGTATSTGTFSVGIPAQRGGIVLSVTARDAAGNTSSATRVTVMDTLPPDAPFVPAVGDNTTTVVGMAEPGATVTIAVGNTVLGRATTGEDGRFSVTIAMQKAGTILSITVTDAAGHSTRATVTVVDTTPPARPTVEATNAGDTTVVGTAEPGARVTVLSGSTVLGTAVADAQGRYSVTIAAQRAGTVLRVTVTDAAGHTSEVAEQTIAPKGTAASASEYGTATASIMADGNASYHQTVDSARAPRDRDGNLVVTVTQRSVTIGRGTNARTADVTRRGASIPLTLLEQLSKDGDQVRLETGFASLSVPARAVAGLSALKGAGAGAAISFSVATETLSSDAQRQLEANGFRINGPVLVLNAAVENGGQTIPVTSFNGEVTVRIPFSGTPSTSNLGIFRRNPATGEWQFVKGRVDAVNKVVVVELRGFSEYAVLEFVRTFSDVPADHPAKADIDQMAARGLVKGFSATEFQPDGEVTRAQFAALLVRVLGLTRYEGTEEQFSDVKAADWFYREVETAARAGLIKGFQGEFRPNDPVSRQEMAVMVVRALALRGHTPKLDAKAIDLWTGYFRDGSAIAEWAREAVATTAEVHIIGGRGAHYEPAANALRHEVTTVLKRFLFYVGDL